MYLQPKRSSIITHTFSFSNFIFLYSFYFINSEIEFEQCSSYLSSLVGTRYLVTSLTFFQGQWNWMCWSWTQHKKWTFFFIFRQYHWDVSVNDRTHSPLIIKLVVFRNPTFLVIAPLIIHSNKCYIYLIFLATWVLRQFKVFIISVL